MMFSFTATVLRAQLNIAIAREPVIGPLGVGVGSLKTTRTVAVMMLSFFEMLDGSMKTWLPVTVVPIGFHRCACAASGVSVRTSASSPNRVLGVMGQISINRTTRCAQVPHLPIRASSLPRISPSVRSKCRVVKQCAQNPLSSRRLRVASGTWSQIAWASVVNAIFVSARVIIHR